MWKKINQWRTGNKDFLKQALLYNFTILNHKKKQANIAENLDLINEIVRTKTFITLQEDKEYIILVNHFMEKEIRKS